MDEVTVEQVVAVVTTRSIQRFEHTVCPRCQRGERFFFYTHQKHIAASVYRQLGCDCAWLESQPSSYAQFVTFLNAQTPTDRAALWAKLVALGTEPVVKPAPVAVSDASVSEPTVSDNVPLPALRSSFELESARHAGV